MLNELHNALRQLVHDHGHIDSLDVDVRFETPTAEWMDSLTRPSISFFLFDVQENTEKRETNMQTIRGNGKAERRMPPRRMDLYYMVSVLADEIEDEHQLLWRLLATLMKHQQLPADVLPTLISSLEPGVTTRIGDQQERGPLLEIWNSLGAQPRAALCYIVTAPLELDIALELPLVLTRTARYRTMGGVKQIDRTRIQIGGVVRDKAGLPLAQLTVRIEPDGEGATTNESGQYVLRQVPSGPVVLSVLELDVLRKQLEVNVPSESYDIVLEK